MSKHIIIGTSGIGGALARRMAGQGIALHLISRNAERLAALASELGAGHSAADVMQPEQLEAAIAEAGPSIDGLAYCVGSINLKPVTRVTEMDAIGDFQLNALGALRAVKAALPALKATAQPSASVLLFSTVAVQQGFASHASVAMAKGAIEGLTRALAAELAPKIRVNAIAPSLTRTPLAAPLTANEQTVSAISALHPLPRLGTPEDMAALGALLLSPDAGWITGQIIGVDGGRSSLRGKG